MKKLIVFILGVMIAFSGISQQSGNVQNFTSIPTKDLQNAAFVIEGMKAKIDLLNSKIQALNKKIALKDSNALEYEKIVSNQASQVILLEKERDNIKEQLSILQGHIKQRTKELRRQKRKTVVVGLAGIAATVFVFIFGS